MVKNFLARILKPRQQVDLGLLAAASGSLLDNAAFGQAREDILRGIVERWLGSDPHASDARERLYQQANALMQIEAQLRIYLAQNKMKAKQ